MATRKQRRRRAKEHRHEYETVYLDDAGNEVEVEPEEREPGRRDTRRDAVDGKRVGKRPARGGRTIDPPSWRRSVRRTLIVAPLFFAFLLIVEQNPGTAFVVALLYSLLFVPFSYGIDTLTYRTQMKRLARRG
jgi:hypothetical protein